MALLCVGLVGLAACDPPDGRDLAVSVPDPPSSIVLGRSVTFDATLSNAGEAAATGTTLAVVAPLGVDVEVAAPSEVECQPPEHAPDLDGMAVTCDVGTVDPVRAAAGGGDPLRRRGRRRGRRDDLGALHRRSRAGRRGRRPHGGLPGRR